MLHVRLLLKSSSRVSVLNPYAMLNPQTTKCTSRTNKRNNRCVALNADAAAAPTHDVSQLVLPCVMGTAQTRLTQHTTAEPISRFLAVVQTIDLRRMQSKVAGEQACKTPHAPEPKEQKERTLRVVVTESRGCLAQSMI